VHQSHCTKDIAGQYPTENDSAAILTQSEISSTAAQQHEKLTRSFSFGRQNSTSLTVAPHRSRNDNFDI